MPSARTSPHKAGDKHYRMVCPEGWESEPMTHPQAQKRLAELAAKAGQPGICAGEHFLVELEP